MCEQSRIVIYESMVDCVSPMRRMQICPLRGIPIINTGDDLPSILCAAIRDNMIIPQTGDVLVVSHTIVSVAENAIYCEKDLEISERAMKIAQRNSMDPKRVELALREAVEVLRESPVLITKTRHGIITDYSAVDHSNAPPGHMLILPKSPDLSAERIGRHLEREFGLLIPVIISDTQGRPWRQGAVNVAVGIYGMLPFIDHAGQTDLYGRIIRSKLICLADELASAAELLMGQADEAIPAVLIRSVPYVPGHGTLQDILRTGSDNLFR